MNGTLMRRFRIMLLVRNCFILLSIVVRLCLFSSCRSLVIRELGILFCSFRDIRNGMLSLICKSSLTSLRFDARHLRIVSGLLFLLLLHP